MTGFKSKKAAAQDKLVVTDIDGHVVRDVRKPKKAALDRDAEIERLNEKIEFLARTNMLYSDWEHRETQVTSDLIRKGIEEAKINAELRAEIAMTKEALKLALDTFERMNHEDSIFAGEFDKEIIAIKAALAQPAQEPEVDLRTRWPMNGWKENKSTPPQRTEQNFCSRCGKRTADLTTIHTCTPPQEKNNG